MGNLENRGLKSLIQSHMVQSGRCQSSVHLAALWLAQDQLGPRLAQGTQRALLPGNKGLCPYWVPECQLHTLGQTEPPLGQGAGLRVQPWWGLEPAVGRAAGSPQSPAKGQ